MLTEIRPLQRTHVFAQKDLGLSTGNTGTFNTVQRANLSNYIKQREDFSLPDKASPKFKPQLLQEQVEVTENLPTFLPVDRNMSYHQTL